MSKIIIYDNKNILIADLERTEKISSNNYEIADSEQPTRKVVINEYAAIFETHTIIHSFSLKKQLKKIEKIIKYHKEKNKNES